MSPSLKHEPVNLSIPQMRNSVLIYGIICCVLYISFLLIMKAFGLLYVTQLRMVNYVLLCFVCMFQIKRWITKTGSFVPFLYVFAVTLATGTWSFLLFSLFLFIYSRYNSYLAELFIKHIPSIFEDVPSIVILFEGSAASIIVAFINLQYFRRYEEEETLLKK